MQKFSQTPCGKDGGEEIKVQAQPLGSDGSSDEATDYKAELDKLHASSDRRKYQQQIEKLQAEVDALDKAASEELDRMLIDRRNELDNATEEYARAEMDKAVKQITAKYDAQIKPLQAQIRALNDKIQALERSE
ncbi:hypothetical protein ACFSJ3_11260 [Corallincola platygyrae]|uniref:Uncharacterized protein n=1 Tax=Corallincola platygyrae TaxID=1193278 RepID=A0ABW4XLV3_9GAMM